MAWVWNRTAKRYQNTDNGQFLSATRALELVEQSLASSGNRAAQLAELVTNGGIAPLDWRNRFGQELKEEYLRQSMLGRGGRLQMTPSDWGAVGRRLQPQYALLDDLALKISEGEFSEAQIKVYQDNYLKSARQVYERSYAVSQGVPVGQLPQMPGDGQQICSSGCNCNWSFNELEDSWECFWNLKPGAKHCDTCVNNNAQWFPLVIPKE